MKRSSLSGMVWKLAGAMRGFFLLGFLLCFAAAGKAADAPYINTWLVLGTFDNTSNVGYNTDLLTGGEANVQPQVGQVLNGQTWRYFDDRLFSRNYDNYNDLYSYYKIKQSLSVSAKAAYALTYVYSSTTQTGVQLWVGSDIGFKAWVNGTYVMGAPNISPSALIQLPGPVEQNGGRDIGAVGGLTLNAGWNRLLLKITNVEAGRFGFYARFKTSTGDDPGLMYSIGGSTGALTISTGAMTGIGNTNTLPFAFREWSYVGAQPNVAELHALSAGTTGPNGQKPPHIAGMIGNFVYNEGLAMTASPFKLTAKGGQAPYTWTKTGGTLPSGLAVSPDGTISGTPDLSAALGNYSFTVKVTDATSANVSRTYTLTVKERPNRAIETDRLIALIHRPESLSSSEATTLANQMKRQGYKVGVPISYNNGDFLFRWPSSYANPSYKTPTDVVQTYKTALEGQGLKFGMYMGNTNRSDDPSLNVNKQILMIEEALRNYQPKVLWFDWLGLDGTSTDSLYSMIKTLSPDTVILLNGSERMSNGDWDILTFEGWNSWGNKAWKTWPVQFPYPKKSASASWRLSVEPGFTQAGGLQTDWRDMLRMQLSLIGEGFIADIDHSPTIIGNPSGAFSTWPLVVQHENMANWASPAGKPALNTAYTGVDRGPLPSASWGYNTINTARNAVYLIALQNPRGKTGLPAGGVLAVGPLNGSVTGVTWMNGNTALPFTTQTVTGGQNITINTSSVSSDQVATIIKLTLAAPLPAFTPPPLPVIPEGWPAAPQIPYGNIATGKPAWLMTPDNASEVPASAANYAVFGVDGNPETQAQGANGWAWSYKVDLQRQAAISRVVAVFGSTTWATEFKILLSQNGSNWQTVVHSTNGAPGANAFDIAPTWARYVRVQAITPNGPDQTGAQMGVAELQVFETNLALGKPSWLRSFDDTYDLPPSGTNQASYGVDGNLNTLAQGANGWAWSYKVDLQQQATINRVSAVFGPTTWATEFKIFVSQNGTTWQTVVHSTSGVPGVNAFDIAPVDARFVRVQAITPNGPNQVGAQMAVAELEVRGMFKGNIAFNKPSELLSADGTRVIPVSANQYAPNGVDGNRASTAAGNEWAWTYHVDLGGVANLSRFVAAFNANAWATEFNIFVSPNGTNWLQVANSTTGTPGDNVINIAPASGRYVRLQAVSPNAPNQTGGQMSVAELEVYE